MYCSAIVFAKQSCKHLEMLESGILVRWDISDNFHSQCIYRYSLYSGRLHFKYHMVISNIAMRFGFLVYYFIFAFFPLLALS